AVKIHADKMIAENTARSRQHLQDHGIDLRIVGRAYRRLSQWPIFLMRLTLPVSGGERANASRRPLDWRVSHHAGRREMKVNAGASSGTGLPLSPRTMSIWKPALRNRRANSSREYQRSNQGRSTA